MMVAQRIFALPCKFARILVFFSFINATVFLFNAAPFLLAAEEANQPSSSQDKITDRSSFELYVAFESLKDVMNGKDNYLDHFAGCFEDDDQKAEQVSQKVEQTLQYAEIPKELLSAMLEKYTETLENSKEYTTIDSVIKNTIKKMENNEELQEGGWEVLAQNIANGIHLRNDLCHQVLRDHLSHDQMMKIHEVRLVNPSKFQFYMWTESLCVNSNLYMDSNEVDLIHFGAYEALNLTPQQQGLLDEIHEKYLMFFGEQIKALYHLAKSKKNELFYEQMEILDQIINRQNPSEVTPEQQEIVNGLTEINNWLDSIFTELEAIFVLNIKTNEEIVNVLTKEQVSRLNQLKEEWSYLYPEEVCEPDDGGVVSRLLQRH